MDHLNDNEELERAAPFLGGLPKADPFVVPEGFFERFPHQVQAVINAQDPPPAPIWAWWKRLALAVPIVTLVSLGVWVLTRGPEPVEVPVVAVTPLTNDELDALDDNEIFAAFDDDDGAMTVEGLGEVALQLNDDELLAYLENEDADITDLIIDTE